MLAMLLDSVGLLVLSGVTAFAGCAPWALRRGSRALAGMVLIASEMACLLPYFVVPALALLTEIPLVRLMALMGIDQAAGIAVAVRMRHTTGRPVAAAV